MDIDFGHRSPDPAITENLDYPSLVKSVLGNGLATPNATLEFGLTHLRH